MNATEEDIAAVEGVGPIIARSVVEWFADQENRQLIEKLSRPHSEPRAPGRKLKSNDRWIFMAREARRQRAVSGSLKRSYAFPKS